MPMGAQNFMMPQMAGGQQQAFMGAAGMQNNPQMQAAMALQMQQRNQ